MIGKSVIVKGRVQGVFYRGSTAEKAKEFGLTGWVRNLPNGDVHFKVFGQPELVDKLIEWSKNGPIMARVDEVLAEEVPFEEHGEFGVRL